MQNIDYLIGQSVQFVMNHLMGQLSMEMTRLIDIFTLLNLTMIQNCQVDDNSCTFLLTK